MRNGTNAQTVHFDALTSQPLNDAAILGIQQALLHGWADPSKLYHSSRAARVLLDEAHFSIAKKLNLKSNEISFATQAPHIFFHVISGLMKSESNAGKKIVLSAIEQSAILSTSRNFDHEIIGVDSNGVVNQTEFLKALDQPQVGLAILQYANHEIGTKQPLSAIYKKCQEKKIALLVDATMTHDLSELNSNFDCLVLNPIAWQGPTGIGVFAVKESVRFVSPLMRDNRENKKFPASPMVALAIGAAAALEETSQKLPEIKSNMYEYKEFLIERIKNISGAVILGDEKNSLSNILAASFEGIDGESLLSELDKLGIEISSGSACMADQVAPSHVLTAIGAPPQSNIRVSFPLSVTKAEVEYFVDALLQALEKIRSTNQSVKL
jgi:cysteine desulfurase